jgi:hypothetical protein
MAAIMNKEKAMIKMPVPILVSPEGSMKFPV